MALDYLENPYEAPKTPLEMTAIGIARSQPVSTLSRPLRIYLKLAGVLQVTFAVFCGAVGLMPLVFGLVDGNLDWLLRDFIRVSISAALVALSISGLLAGYGLVRLQS